MTRIINREMEEGSEGVYKEKQRRVCSDTIHSQARASGLQLSVGRGIREGGVDRN